jgi:hypothetical protein
MTATYDDTPTSSPVLLRMADVQPVAVEWLWPGRIPLGKLSILAGDPGLGKSFATLDMAARVSRGTPWPDAPLTSSPAGDVVLLSAEDDPADTIRPRLDAAGADVSRIIMLTAVRIPADDGHGAVDRGFCLAVDLPHLRSAIASVPRCRLVVIDPISAYLGDVDSHVNAEVRGVLTPLAELAASTRVAVVGVQHLRKSDGPAVYRSMGSLAFVAASRATWAVARDPDDTTGRRRLLLPVKCNLSDDTGGLAYELRPVDGTAVVSWDTSPVSATADDVLGATRRGGKGSASDDAAEWLRAQLADGPVETRELTQRAEDDGIAWRTVKRAKDKVGAKASKRGYKGPWVWFLPGDPEAPADCPRGPDSSKGAKCATPGMLAPFDDVGPLGAPEPVADDDGPPPSEDDAPPAADDPERDYAVN